MNRWHAAQTRRGEAVGVVPTRESSPVWALTKDGQAVAGTFAEADMVDGRKHAAGIYQHDGAFIAWSDLEKWQEAPRLVRREDGEMELADLPF